MKTFFIILIIISCSIFANAQQNIFKNKPWEDFKKKELTSEKLKRLGSATDGNIFLQTRPIDHLKNPVLKIPLTGIFIEKTGKGADLFVMNTDKMPCIVPDKTFTSNMPVAGYDKSFKNNLLPLKEETEEK